MRTVLANRLRGQRRAERRRHRREEKSGATAEVVASPEELMGRLEVQKTLADLVAGLDEPARTTVLLHYYEGLSSTEIGVATATPPGTVRWRLKTAVDELRRRVEARYREEKRDWRRALLPLLPASRAARPEVAPAGGLMGRARWWLWGVAGAGVLVMLVFLVTGSRRNRGASAETTGRGPGEQARSTSGGPELPGGKGGAKEGRRGGRPVAFTATARAVPCVEALAPLEARFTSAREALAYHLPPNIAWSDAGDGPSNPEAASALQPIVAKWLDDHGAPRERRSLDCRGDSCIAKVVEPWPARPPWVHRHPSDGAQRDLVARARSIELEGPIRKRKLLSADLAETHLWLRLHNAAGVPGSSTAPQLPADLLPSAVKKAPPQDGAALTEACRQRRAELEQSLEDLRRRAVKLVAAEVLFDSEAPSPALAEKMQAEVGRFFRETPELTEDQRRKPLRAECRGAVCRFTPLDGGSVSEDLVKRLIADAGIAVRVRRSSVVTRNGRLARPLHLVLLPEPGDNVRGEDALRSLLNQIRASLEGGFKDCLQRFPATGSLTVRFVLPATGELNDDGLPDRVSFRLEGTPAEAPFGACLAALLAPAVSAYRPPPEVTRGVASKTIEIP